MPALSAPLADALMLAHIKAHSGAPEIIGQLHMLYFFGFQLASADLVNEIRRAEHHALDLAAKVTKAREEAEKAAGVSPAPARPVRKFVPVEEFRPIGEAANVVVRRLARGEGETP